MFSRTLTLRTSSSSSSKSVWNVEKNRTKTKTKIIVRSRNNTSNTNTTTNNNNNNKRDVNAKSSSLSSTQPATTETTDTEKSSTDGEADDESTGPIQSKRNFTRADMRYSNNLDDTARIQTLKDGNARLRVCSDGRVSLFYAHYNGEEASNWELVSSSYVTVPPGCNRIGKIVSARIDECLVEFYSESNELVSTLKIKALSNPAQDLEWTKNLSSGFIVDYEVKTFEGNEFSVEMAEIVTDVESAGKWFGGGHFVRQEWPLNGACLEVGPHYPFDFGPHGINTLVSNHWVTSKGLAIVADPETTFFHVGLNAPKENTFFEAWTPNGSRRKFHTGVANILRPQALPLTSKMRVGDGKLRLQSRSGFCDSKYGAFSQEHPLVGWRNNEETHPIGNLALEQKNNSALNKNNGGSNKKKICTMRVALLAKKNVREATENVLESMPKPTKIVDTNLTRGPKWSTWARYKTAVDQEKVTKYAKEIVDEYQYERSIMEIDDRWSSGYGELEFDAVKFPDPKQMVDELHNKGFKVTLWVTPFVTEQTKAYQEGVEKGYFVKSKVLTPGHSKPGFFSWWQPSGVVAIDLTNKDARDWFLNGLKSLQERYGIDGFKFDAGEPCFLPKEFETKIPMKHPSEYTRLWSTEIAKTFEICEVRSAHHSTDSGVWTRIGDTFSSWTTSNGLRSLIPHLLTSSIVGYPLCLPDMIGGNAYGVPPSNELFTRWAQANVFMPAMQFSIPPWEFGAEVAEATKKIMQTRSKIIELIEDLSIESSKSLMPICSPLWWLAPEDENTFDVNDQFCLGNDIVVAPVVYDKQRKRDIYLPKGEWKEFEGTKTFDFSKGGQWIRNYEAWIHDIPAFKRVV